MTSSLVGSEMCIRDRPTTITTTATTTATTTSTSTKSHMNHTHGVIEAVSYTHLTLPTICSV
eukprot:782234-Prorocentrum_lima.AAC.1